jgi:hypothetical protein
MVGKVRGMMVEKVVMGDVGGQSGDGESFLPIGPILKEADMGQAYYCPGPQPSGVPGAPKCCPLHHNPSTSLRIQTCQVCCRMQDTYHSGPYVISRPLCTRLRNRTAPAYRPLPPADRPIHPADGPIHPAARPIH